MEWFKNNFAASESFEDIDRHAQSSIAKAFSSTHTFRAAFPDNSISAKACVMGLSLNTLISYREGDNGGRGVSAKVRA